MRLILIGGGIVGLATATKLLRRYPSLRLTILEKEAQIGQHQTSHNSGVLHAGLYYQPGSVKAKLAVSGIREMVAFCRDQNIAHEICGKLVVATNSEEKTRLAALHLRGEQNGLQGIKMLTPEEMREIEPHAQGVAALHVPEEGIVNYRQVAAALSKQVTDAGGQIVTKAKVTGYRLRNEVWEIHSQAGVFEADFLVNCAGLHCDRVSALGGDRREVRIVPFRGEYYKLKAPREGLVRNLIYPVPDPQFPFLGVHFTRLIGGGIEAGPNAVLAFAREGYRKTDVNVSDLWDAVSYPGLWRFLQRHKRMSWEELCRSFSKRLFCQSLQKLVPEVQEADLETGGAGVRAQAMSADGTLVQDFYLVNRARALHVLNAPSPAATASLAIGEEITRRIAAVL